MTWLDLGSNAKVVRIIDGRHQTLLLPQSRVLSSTSRQRLQFRGNRSWGDKMSSGLKTLSNIASLSDLPADLPQTKGTRLLAATSLIALSAEWQLNVERP